MQYGVQNDRGWRIRIGELGQHSKVIEEMTRGVHSDLK
jgi:hypothetical protein